MAGSTYDAITAATLADLKSDILFGLLDKDDGLLQAITGPHWERTTRRRLRQAGVPNAKVNEIISAMEATGKYPTRHELDKVSGGTFIKEAIKYIK